MDNALEQDAPPAETCVEASEAAIKFEFISDHMQAPSASEDFAPKPICVHAFTLSDGYAACMRVLSCEIGESSERRRRAIHNPASERGKSDTDQAHQSCGDQPQIRYRLYAEQKRW